MKTAMMAVTSAGGQCELCVRSTVREAQRSGRDASTPVYLESQDTAMPQPASLGRSHLLQFRPSYYNVGAVATGGLGAEDAGRLQARPASDLLVRSRLQMALVVQLVERV